MSRVFVKTTVANAISAWTSPSLVAVTRKGRNVAYGSASSSQSFMVKEQMYVFVRLTSNGITQYTQIHTCSMFLVLSYHMQGMRSPSLPRRRRNVKPKLKRRGRPPRKRKFRSNPWEDDDEVSDKDADDDEDDLRHYKMNGRKGGKRKWNYTFKEDEEDMFVEAVIDDDEPSNTEEVSDF